MRRIPSFSSRRGFTLIELLVVITIIAILMTLVFSGAHSMMDHGRSAKCIANMRQIYLGMQAYLQDNNNHLMQRFYGGDGYDEVLLPYVENEKKIFTCPSQKRANYPAQPGYGLNWYYDNQSVFRVDQPSKTILLAESRGGGTGSHRADRDSGAPGQLDSERHSGGVSNYLFFDGHVQSLKYSQTREVVSSAQTPEGEEVPIDMWGYNYDDHTRPQK